ncbi:hypothetical protein [Photorhabdus namnaonensis]|uniref:Ig-like domain-containing protein n=1 Tax=Photorhabdus namnaonensis TaxID=1851568 RepID=A0A1B8YEN7_9GAMM|nr:hypothetical protein [Photorhabdus namnaonensis]OCA53586.1 hypothetical protein Phpb_03327 [Photorhabdus namnaonensis]
MKTNSRVSSAREHEALWRCVLIVLMLLVARSAFATDHWITVINNSFQPVKLSDFKARCAAFAEPPDIIPPYGGRVTIQWTGKQFELGHPACANSTKINHTSEWVAFKANITRKGTPYSEYLGMTWRSDNCIGLICGVYYTALFYANEIDLAPSDNNFNPLPFYPPPAPHHKAVPAYFNGKEPDGIIATCDYVTPPKSCMGSFDPTVSGKPLTYLYYPGFPVYKEQHWTFTINEPPEDIKISFPVENEHFIAEDGGGVDISGTAEPGSTVEFGYDGNPKNYTTMVGADGKWKGSIPYLEMLSQLSYGDITHTTIYARYVTQLTYDTNPDKRNIQIAEPVKVTVNGLDADNNIKPGKDWTVQGMKSTTGTVSGEVCEEEGHKNCIPVPLSADNSMYWVTSAPIPTASGNYEFTITQKLKDFKDSTARFSAMKNTPFSVSEPQPESDHSEPYLLTPAGRGTSGADVEYTIDGKSFPTVRITSDHWTGTQTSLASGSHNLIATEILGSGKQEKVTTYFTVAARVVITSPTTNQWVSPSSSLTVTGKAEPSAKISCVMDDDSWFGSNAITSSSGDFSCKVSVPSNSGKHTLTVTQTINSKEQGKAVQDIVVAAPLTIESAVQDFENHGMTIKGTKDKSTSLVYQLDNNKPSDSTSYIGQADWHVDFTRLAHGKHKFLAYQVIDGESSVPVEGDFEIVTPVSITSPAEGGSVLEHTRFAVQGEGEPGARVQVDVNNIDVPWITVVDGSGRWFIEGPSSDWGTYQYTATASKDGKTLNTVCRNVRVIGLYSHNQSESVDLCSENPEALRRVK